MACFQMVGHAPHRGPSALQFYGSLLYKLCRRTTKFDLVDMGAYFSGPATPPIDHKRAELGLPNLESCLNCIHEKLFFMNRLY